MLFARSIFFKVSSPLTAIYKEILRRGIQASY